MVEQKHFSVLLQESVDALISDVDGVYIDGTFGRGGHSREILKRLGGSARLLGIDKDPEAVAEGRILEGSDTRFTMVHSSFLKMREQLENHGISAADGIILDLGVSSPQLDSAQRGFSFTKDGPLDMRMDFSRGVTAAQWLKHAEEKDIAHVLKVFGEERFARRIARAIVANRENMDIDTTRKLADIVSAANPKWEKGKHPATRSFQAIRIYINRELEDLSETLDIAVKLLKEKGRIVIISFHSLEDRIVKRFFREKSRGRDIPPSVPVTEGMLGKELKIVGKAVKPGDMEVDANIRSRSAIMRIAEKI